MWWLLPTARLHHRALCSLPTGGRVQATPLAAVQRQYAVQEARPAQEAAGKARAGARHGGVLPHDVCGAHADARHDAPHVRAYDDGGGGGGAQVRWRTRLHVQMRKSWGKGGAADQPDCHGIARLDGSRACPRPHPLAWRGGVTVAV